ncbi:hypothetical protein H9P43_009015 [Blastocladiella emersonii ATCC 22665]|nr:hypothetical protein H9P43_009015 [Blastocladiella emersonii ATCC 22665]
MKTNFDVAELIERVLVCAVHLSDPADVAGLMQHARVLPLDRIPAVAIAILQHAPALSMDAASARGAVGVLDKWRSSGLPLVYSSAALRDANMSSLEVMEWWAASGLPIELPDYNSGRSLREHCTLQSLCLLFPDKLPVSANCVSIEQAVTLIASGQATEVAIANQHCSLAAIAQLNAAMASPDQVLRSLKLKQCTLDIPRLLEFRFPDSLTHLEWKQGWTSRRVGGHSELFFRSFPETLRSLSLEYVTLEPSEYCCFSLLPRGITDLTLRGCQLEGDAFGILFPHLPPALVSLDLRANSLTATQLSAVYHHLPPTLRSLNLFNTDIFRADISSGDEDEIDTSLLGWTLPAGLDVLKMGHCSETWSKRERASKNRGMARAMLAAMLAASVPPNLVSMHLTNVELCDAPHQPLENVFRSRTNRFHPGAPSPSAMALLAPRLSPSLRELNLRHTCIGAAGARLLADHMPPGLVLLDVSRADIDDMAVGVLAPVLPQTLKDVDLGWSLFTNAGARVLAAHLPDGLARLGLSRMALGREVLELLNAKLAIKPELLEDEGDW